ncbi:Abi family protein [Enterobacter hormaechei]|uniref:Abi family protein n=1 Tax=Enterobacter hormaechei TaxID=158836 RepID=UPI0007A76633|nr:Abi family protein [Enterobacter hormaechei]
MEQDILDKISEPRLAKYRTGFQLSSDDHAYAVYLWNKMLAGAMIPVMQSIEVSLRNSINHAIQTDPRNYGRLWFRRVYRPKDLPSNFEKLHHEIVNKFTSYDLDLLRENKDPNYKAILDATYEKKIKKGTAAAKKLYNQHIVGNLMFGSWGVLLSAEYVDNTHKNKLWPNLTGTVFPNAVGVEKDNLFNIYNDVRLFRNRVSHNEPLWRPAITGNVIADSTEQMNQRYNSLLHALGLISAKKREQLEKSLATQQFREICSREFYLKLVDNYVAGRIRICKRCKTTYRTSTNRGCNCNSEARF